MPDTVLIVHSVGPAYDSLGALIELTVQDFCNLGFDVIIVIWDGLTLQDQLLDVLRSGTVRFAVTLSGIGAEARDNDGQLLWDKVGVPLFTWQCDHPAYFPARHTLASTNIVHGYLFADHARYHIAHLRPNGLAFSVPFGLPDRTCLPRPPQPATARNGRVIFLKSGLDIAAIEQSWRDWPPIMQAILFAAAETLRNRRTDDALPVLQAIAADHGVHLDGGGTAALTFIREIDRYVRGWQSRALVEAIRDFPVDVYGHGWDGLDWTTGAARLHAPLDWKQGMRRLGDYSAALSLNPLVEDSLHDRVFCGLAAAVPPVFDTNRFACAHMPTLADFTFEAGSSAGVQAALAAVLDRPADAIARADAAYHALRPSLGLHDSARRIAEFMTWLPMNGRA